MDFPKDAFKTLASALASKQFTFATAQAAISVLSWLIETAGNVFSHATPAAGTLAASAAPLDDESAAKLFDSLAGDGPQAALDPTVAKALLSYLGNLLLPFILKKLSGG